jgi:hypothetical protein
MIPNETPAAKTATTSTKAAAEKNGGKKAVFVYPHPVAQHAAASTRYQAA